MVETMVEVMAADLAATAIPVETTGITEVMVTVGATGSSSKAMGTMPIMNQVGVTATVAGVMVTAGTSADTAPTDSVLEEPALWYFPSAPPNRRGFSAEDKLRGLVCHCMIR
jgi:hypothetical protein